MAKEEIEIELDSLVFYERNAKEHTPIQVQDLAQSIVDFGFHTLISINEKNVIIGGHGRALAAKRLGLKTVRAIRVTGLDERKERIARIGLNKLRRDVGYEPQGMKELYSIAESGFDISNYCWENKHEEQTTDKTTDSKPEDEQKFHTLKFPFDEVLYDEVWQRLSLLRVKHKFQTDGQALMWLLAQHQEAHGSEG